jgi:hypothetical protein
MVSADIAREYQTLYTTFAYINKHVCCVIFVVIRYKMFVLSSTKCIFGYVLSVIAVLCEYVVCGASHTAT